MHELALSQNIVRTALEASGADKRCLATIAVEVGALSAANVASLEFCMRLVLDEQSMQQVEVRITEKPATVECRCGLRFQPEDMFSPCPECDGFDREVTEGRDVIIQYVEVEDEEG